MLVEILVGDVIGFSDDMYIVVGVVIVFIVE